MRGTGWILASVGAVVGIGVAAYALRWADFSDASGASALDDRARLVLIGLAIVVVACVVGLIVERRGQWATYVFIGVAALAVLFGLGWAVTAVVEPDPTEVVDQGRA